MKDYDYSQSGLYYVTVCTQDRIERFGNVLDNEMILTEAREMVDAEWNRIPERYDHVLIDTYQIMPNHMHGIIQIIPVGNDVNKPSGNRPVGTPLVGVLNDDGESSSDSFPNDIAACERTGTRPVPTLGSIIGEFKSITTVNYANHVRQNDWSVFSKRLWQLRFHDHIIRNETELNRGRKYIIDNPQNWLEDENNPENIDNETDS